MSELHNALQQVLEKIDKKEKDIAYLAKFIEPLEGLLAAIKGMTTGIPVETLPPQAEAQPAPKPVAAKPVAAPTPPPQPVAPPVVLKPEEELPEIKKLLEGKAWPHAVSPDLIVNDESEADKFERAEGVVEITLPSDKREISILDLGCGEGHFVFKAVEKGYAKAVGYDIEKPAKPALEWAEFKDKRQLTTAWEDVVKEGPYNHIVLFDVLDHIKNEQPVELLQKARSVLAPDGVMFVRCHPWCSRHGAHLYKKINKAWVQLVLTEEELESLGLKPEQNLKVLSPRKTYENWFQQAGLKVTNLDTDRTSIEQFFVNTQVIKDRILRTYNVTNGFPQFQMEQSFLDYTLKSQ